MDIKGRTVFENRFAARNAIAEITAKHTDLSEGEIDVFCELISLPYELDDTKKSPSSSPALIGNFAINNQDLYDLEKFLKFFAAAAKLLVFAPQIGTVVGWGGTASSLHDLYKLFQSLKDSGYTLSEHQLIIISIIRSEGPIHTEAIAERLPREIYDLGWQNLVDPFLSSTVEKSALLQKDESEFWSAPNL